MLKKLKILFLNREDVNRLLPYAPCITEMEAAMKAVSRGDAVMPIRSMMPIPDGRGVLGMMPGFMTTPDSMGIKVVSVFPGNFGTEYGSHQGLVILYDTENGAPTAIVDGGAVTAIRTAAATAAATKALARKNSKILTIFGYGEQAETHLDAMMTLDMFEVVRIWGRDANKVQAFVDANKGRYKMQLIACTDPEVAVRGADVVCTTTAAAEPVLMGDWLEPGMHINAVGSSVPSTAEIDTATIAKSKLYADYIPSLKELGGDYRTAISDGAITEDHIVGEVGHVLLGQCEGRVSDDEITLFKSLGMVSEDLIACQYVFDKGRQHGVGQWITM